MTHHSNHAALFVIALSITVLIVGLYGYMRYTIGSSIEKAIAAQQTTKDEQARKDQKQNLALLYSETARGRASLPSFFVADDQKVRFIEKIESFGDATQAKIALADIVADDLSGSPVGTLGRISVRVDVTGSWQSVMRVLKLAETLPYKSTVSGVRLGASETGPDKPEAKRQWRLTFTLEGVSIRNQI